MVQMMSKKKQKNKKINANEQTIINYFLYP